MFELDALRLAVEGDGDLGSTQTTDTQPWVIFQELAIGPFPWSTCPESCDHNCEGNLCSVSYLSWLRSLTALALCWSASAVNPPQDRRRARRCLQVRARLHRRRGEQ